MKKVLITIAIILGTILLILGAIIIYATATDYAPEPVETIRETANVSAVSDTLEMKILIWNIGYCGLDAKMDFFYDGGKQTRTTNEAVIKNMKAIKQVFIENSDIDIFLCQEVDINSKRSYYNDQYTELCRAVPGYYPAFAKNYDVFFVPLPFSAPLGAVESGLMTLSRFEPSNITRHTFPGNYAWPKRVFMLDRCFMVNRYQTMNDKELLVINTHKSAYDDGSLRQQQMAYLKDFILAEYAKGNYIIVGGDWNQCPPNIQKKFDGYNFDTEVFSEIPSDYLSSDWRWIYDTSIPTNRRLDEPYDQKMTNTTIIDFFLVSPNINCISVKTLNFNFLHSDHQPVKLVVKMNSETNNNQ